VRHGPDAGSTYRLDQPATAIGRHPDSEIFLDDITVSRRHVVVDKKDDGFVLRDVGSLNGTYVNRKRVDEARLEHGDEVQIGRYRLSFVVGGHQTEQGA
jgi:pSer/pThr/pTyr-binding forkhead associated (FHA) protein